MVVPALAPASVRADDCMCLPPQMVLAPREPRFLESVEVGPFFSSDGSTLTSEELAVEEQPAPAQARPLARRDGGEVPWCVSADDPRCWPRDSAPYDGPHARDATSAGAEAPTPLGLGPPDARAVRPRVALGAPRAAVRGRVDRPPGH